MGSQAVSKQTIQRLPLYLNYLRLLPPEGSANISATAIADALKLNDVQVRKDLASVSSGGRPKIGYATRDLILAIEQFLGYNDTASAILFGAGNLGRALLSYDGFARYGVNLVAAFDTDPDRIAGGSVNGKPVLPADKFADLCERLKVRIGIIAVPASAAQAVCDRMAACGIQAVWNFAPVHLRVPEAVLVQNENMASSLAVLSKHLRESLGRGQT